MAVRPFHILSLFSGICGLERGIQRVLPAANTVCFVEREAYLVGLLAARMEAGDLESAPIYSDVRTFDAERWRGCVDLVTAGFPCQPFSTASRGRRVAVDLWPFARDAIRYSEAPIVFLENVARAPIERAGSDLAELGYRCQGTKVSAADVGAPHERERFWLLAHAHDAEQSIQRIHAEMACAPETPDPRWQKRPDCILGMDDGSPYRGHRFRALGGAVCPQQAALAFRVLAERLMT